MKLNDLINERNQEEVVLVSLCESLDESIITLEEAKFQTFEFKKVVGNNKDKFITVNPFTKVLAKYKSSDTFLNSGSIALKDAKAQEKTFDSAINKFQKLVSGFETKANGIKDGEKEKGLTLKKTVLEAFKARQKELKTFNKIVASYEKMVAKSFEEFKSNNSNKLKTASKSKVAERLAGDKEKKTASKKAASDNFKKNVRSKLDNAKETSVRFKSDFKKNVFSKLPKKGEV